MDFVTREGWISVKKVFISVDLEGMEGVVSKLQTLRSNPDFGLARKRLTLDVNAAVEGALLAGAEEIVVCDGHADMENILLDDLHPEVKLISGAMRSSLQMQGIEGGYDALVVFGHAGGGLTIGGVMDHTYNSMRVYNIRMNGVTVNTEAVMNGMIAGYYGVPLAVVIGDEAMVNEVKEFAPRVEGVIVKSGFSRFSALSLSPLKAREAIREGVKKGLARAKHIEPLTLAEPIEMEIDFRDAHTADAAELVPGVKRLTPRTVSFTGDGPTVFKLQELLLFRLLDEYPF